MSTTTAARPIEVTDLEFDALTSFDSVPTLGRSLRAGMLLVDPDLGTPVYFLDHRMPGEPGRWFVFDYTVGRNGAYGYTNLAAARRFPAATGIAE